MTLVFLFTFAIGQMWADVTFTQDKITSSGYTDVTSGVTIQAASSIETGSQHMYATSTAKSNFVKIGSSAGTDLSKSKSFIEVSISSGSITSITVYGATNKDDEVGTEAFVCWDGTAAISTTNHIGYGEWTCPHRKGESSTPNSGAITMPSGTKIVRIYRGVTIKDDKNDNVVLGASTTPCITSIKVSYASSCAATAPGNISKGELTSGSITLTAAGSAASGDTWYWQDAADGTATNKGTGATKSVNVAGTYYIRSYNTAGECWSDAKSFTVTTTDLVANYTVVYKDGTTELGSEVVEVGKHPKAEGITTTKEFFAFAAWQESGVDKDLDAVSAANGETVTLTARYTAQYTSGTYEFTGHLTMGTDPQMTISNSSDGQNYAAGRIDNIYVSAQKIGYEATGDYGGWKLKTTNGTLRFLVENTCGIRVSLGEANPLRINYTEGGTAKSADIAKSTTSAIYKADANSLVTLTNFTANNKTVTLKKIEILPLYNATYTTSKSSVDPTSASSVTEVTLPTPSETTVGGYSFTGWVADKTVYDDEENEKTAGADLTAGKTYTLTATTEFTAQWTLISDFDVKFFQGYGDPDVQIGDKQTISTGNFAVAPADPSRDGYNFKGWSYDATEEHIVNVAEYAIIAATNFTAIWKQVFAVTFDGEGSVNVESGSKVASPNSPSQTGKVFLGWYTGENKWNFADNVTEAMALTSKWEDADHFFYNYKDAFHYDGFAYKNPKGEAPGSGDNKALSTPWTLCDACVAGVTKVEATAAIYDSKGDHMNAYIKLRKDDNGKIVFTIAENFKATIKIKMGGYSGANTNITMKLNDSGDNILYTGTMSGAATTENGYAELTYANLAAGAYTLKPTSGSLYISHIDIQTTPIYTVTHTLTGATTSSATKADAGVAYEATYVAESGYSLPASITVKVGGSTIDAENYTWDQSTGALTIPVAQVTGNIQVIVVGDFTCPAAGSGDVLFSWTPKSGSVSTEYIAAGGVDLAPYMESVVGGSITGYAQAIDETTTTLYKNSNNHVYFNGNSAYIKVDLCELAEGDKILVSGQDKNMWVSTSATRPANAEAAAAVLVPGEAFYVPNASALIGLSTIYIFREASFTEVASLTITRSKKFTVTYAASELTEGAVPAAVDAFDGQKIIVAGQGTMVKGADHFAGWKDAYNNEYAEGDELTVTAKMTLTAQWTACTPLTLDLTGYETELLAGGATTTATLDKGSSTGTVTWESSNTEVLTVENGVITPVKGGTATVTAHVAEDGTYCGNDVTSAEITVKATVIYDANAGGNETGTMEDGVGASVTVVANAYAYADHKFLRWNTQPDGLGDDVAVGATVNENKTLYAIWKEVTCPTGANIFSIEFTNDEAVKMSYNDPELDLASYATIVGGNAYMKYFNGTNTNQTVVNTNHQVVYGTNNMYLKLDLDCELQAGDVISFEDFSGSNQLTIAVDLTSGAPKDAAKKVSATGTGTTRTYTVEANDALEGESVLFIGRPASGSLYHKVVTVYRPAPDAPVPTINNATPADAEYTGAASPMTVAVEVTGAEDLHYQWYKEAGETDIEVGTDAASYTPTASGEYYCVVTNSPTGYTPKSATSRTATITMISSDATLAWLKADGNDIALSDGEYAYEYVIADAATVAPTITAGKNEEHASVTITQADSKTGTATVHVVAEDGETSHDYTVKFNEFSGCLTTFYFSYADDADENHVTNNAQLRGHTVFTDLQSNGSSYGGTLTVNDVDYTATKSTSSKSSFGKLVVPAKYSATLYLLVRIGSSNTSLQLVKEGESTPYMSSDVYAEEGTYQYNFENVQAGTYVIRAWRNGSVQNCNYIAMAAELCRYEVSSVSLANMTLRTGNTATPEMTITPAKGSVVSQAWSIVGEGGGTIANINETTGVVSALAEGDVTVKVVLNGDDNLSATCTVHVIADYELATVDGSATWDWNDVPGDQINSDNGVGVVLANKIAPTATFKSDELEIFMQYLRRTSNNKVFCQGQKIHMETTVPGILKVTFRNTGGNGKRTVQVNGIFSSDVYSENSGTDATYVCLVPAGPVNIEAVQLNADGEFQELSYIQIHKIEFDADPDHHREGLSSSNIGTLCWTNNAVIWGATLYEFAGKNENNYLVFDEVVDNRIEAGKPYIFMPENGQTEIKVFNMDNADALTEAELQPVNNMYGTFEGKDLRPDQDEDADMYYFSGHNIWRVGDFTVEKITIPAYRCYVDYPAVLAGAPAAAPAPGRRRVTMGVNGKDVVTGMENINASDKPLKVMIDGQLFIIRGEKVFDATGRLVK